MCYCPVHKKEHEYGVVVTLEKGICDCGNPYLIKSCVSSGVVWEEHLGELFPVIVESSEIPYGYDDEDDDDYGDFDNLN